MQIWYPVKSRKCNQWINIEDAIVHQIFKYISKFWFRDFILFSRLKTDNFWPIPTVSKSEKNRVNSCSVHCIFAKYNDSSNFFVNSANNSIYLSIFTAVWLFLYLIDRDNKYLRNIEVLKRAIKRGKSILQNYIFGKFFGEFLPFHNYWSQS